MQNKQLKQNPNRLYYILRFLLLKFRNGQNDCLGSSSTLVVLIY